MSLGSRKAACWFTPSKYPDVDRTVCTVGSGEAKPLVGEFKGGRPVMMMLSLMRTGSPMFLNSRYNSRMLEFKKG